MVKYIGLLCLFFSSCVSRATYVKDMKAMAELGVLGIKLANERCAAESALKDARLRQFNQLNKDGTLR